jgi:alpha-tubulin suppressor-like RCC1 family protein
MMIQVCGSNFFGQLACPTLRDTVTPCSWTDLESLDVNSIVDVQCCSHCTVVTTKEGLIFICGSINSKIYPSFVFVETSLPLKCVQVACGRKHILALMTGGYVLAWGSGYLGQLGLGDDMSWDTPQLVRGLDPQRLGGPVTRVFCGGYHSGVSYSW